MKKYSNFKKRRSFFGLFFLFFSIYLQGFAGINFIEANLTTTQQLAAQQDKLFFIYYNAEWCMPCKWMEENTFLDPELVNYINTEYIAVKANISGAEGRVLKEQFEVTSIPSILVFSASGHLVDRKSSSVTSEDLLQWLQDWNLPQHHLKTPLSFSLATSENRLNSPRADIHFQRPSLIPDDSPAGLLTEMENNYQQQTSTGLVASNKLQFSPRSSLHYSIKLTSKDYRYEAAVREVLLLEQKYSEPIELIAADGQQLSIVIGRFETTGKAQAFLRFLNRNNIKGQIIALNSSK